MKLEMIRLQIRMFVYPNAQSWMTLEMETNIPHMNCLNKAISQISVLKQEGNWGPTIHL